MALATANLPPGSGGKFHIQLSGESLDTTIQLLAALSAMQVTRDELIYRFEPLAEDAVAAKFQVRVPPDLTSRLAEMAGVGTPQTLGEILAALGFHLDPATRVKVSSSGELTVESARPADASAIFALVEALGSERPTQQKIAMKMIDLPADLTWKPPPAGQMTDEQVAAMLRDVASQPGAKLETLPAITMRSGHPGKIEMIRELLWEEKPGAFKKQPVGVVIEMKGSALGFGQDLEFHYRQTSGDIDPATGKPAIQTDADIADTGFVPKNGTILRIERRPDGSKRLLLVASHRIDATGRPVE